jgi:rhodanese-related sulfurtransferase
MTSPSTSMTSAVATISRRRRRLRLVVPGLALIALAGCSGDEAGTTIAAPASIAATGTTEPVAAGRLAAEAALADQRTVIDVRTPEEYEAGHVDGAARIGLADLDFAAQIAKLDPAATYVVYCRTGNRSAQAAAEMRALSLDVYDGGGLDDMVAAGWPVAS